MVRNNTSDDPLAEARVLLEQGRWLLAAANVDQVFLRGAGDDAIKRKALWVRLYAYNRLQWLVDGSAAAEQLLAFRNLDSDDYLELALYRVLLGQSEQARKYFKLAMAQSPNNALLYSELAITYEQQGNIEKSLGIYEQIVNRCVKRGKLSEVDVRVFSRLAALRNLHNTEYQLLKKSFKRNSSAELTTRIAHTLAKAYRKQGATEQEIDWLITANERAKLEADNEGSVWSHQQAAERTALIQETFAQSQPDWWPDTHDHRKAENHGDNIPMPIFILGMPRSGTTLLEQIIGGHSAVGNTGESRGLDIALFKATQALGLQAATGQFSLIRNVPKLSARGLKALRGSYIEYQQLLSNKAVLTDKALSHVSWVGLLANLFTRAKFVYIERNVLDNCVSLLQQDFKNAPYSNTPTGCVLEHADYHKKIMHWKTLYPDRLHCLKYETLVAEPATEACDLLKFLGLHWEDRVLDFKRRSNSVRTPSVGQVRQAINTRQIEKWRKYERLIKPAIGVAQENGLFAI